MYVLFSDEYSLKYCLAFVDEESALEWARANNLKQYDIRYIISIVSKKSEQN